MWIRGGSCTTDSRDVILLVEQAYEVFLVLKNDVITNNKSTTCIYLFRLFTKKRKIKRLKTKNIEILMNFYYGL